MQEFPIQFKIVILIIEADQASLADKTAREKKREVTQVKQEVKSLFNSHLSRQQTTTPDAKADIPSDE